MRRFVFLYLFFMIGITSSAVSIPPEVVVRWLPAEGGDAGDVVRDRIEKGKNLQALVLIPESATPGGPLLDPADVRVSWNGELLEHYTLFKRPDLALVFALPTIDEDALRTTSTLSLSLPFYQNGDRHEVESATSVPAGNVGELDNQSFRRRLRIYGQDGEQLAGAYLFGQRREDLFTRADDNGRVVLDAPTRNAASPHIVWTESHWPVAFDPITSRTITLQYKQPEITREITVSVTGPNGEPVPNAILLSNHVEYTRFSGEPVTIEIPTIYPTPLYVVAPGYKTSAKQITPEMETVTVRLDQ